MQTIARIFILLSVLLGVASCRSGVNEDITGNDDTQDDVILQPFPPMCSMGESGDILERVADLRKTAWESTGGVLGCGFGSITIVTSQGEVTVACSLDPIHVFGGRVKVSDIHSLLESRIESNRTGKEGPMAGGVGDLCYVCLSTLALAKDPESIPVIVPLLDDKDEVVRAWAAIALFRLAEADERLAERIKTIEFPEPALRNARGRGNPPPPWVIERRAHQRDDAL